MTDSNADDKSFNTFTQKALGAAPSLGSPVKINLSFIVQAFRLRKNLSGSMFFAFVILFFWISILGLLVFSSAYGVFGKGFLDWVTNLLTKPSGSVSMVPSFVQEISVFICGALISLFGIGFAWRFHVGQKKKFLATMPSYSLFFRLLWPLVVCNIVFTALFLSLSMLINTGLVTGYLHFFAQSSTNKYIHFMGYAVQFVSFAAAIIYWLVQGLVLYVLFKRYKQDKSGEAISPFFRSFYLSFKPFFKQGLRILITIACFYLIIFLPLLVIKPLVGDMPDDLVKHVKLGFSLVYLILVPWIIATFFNLYFLIFHSIENYKPGSKSTLDQLNSKMAEPEVKVKPKKPKSKPSKAINKKPAGSTSTPPKTGAKKKPASKVNAKLKSGSSSKK